MRNLKRVLSLALALVMMLGMMVIGANAASADFADADEITNTEAVEIMTALKVIEGDGTNFNPNDILTREQAAKIICYMLMGPANAEKLSKNTSIFKDVAAGRWSAGYIAYCANLGIIAGNGDDTFDPEGQLTGVAFGKMLLVALGYDAEIEGYVGKNWATEIATDMIAAGIDVDGVSLDAPLTRDNACQMAFQTLTADLVTYTSKGTNITMSDGTKVVVGASPASKPAYGNTVKYDGTADGVQQFCEKYFKTLKLNTTTKVADAFGRPGYTWEVDNKVANDIFVVETPVATFTAKTSAADVAKALNGYKLHDQTNNKDCAINNTTTYTLHVDSINTGYIVAVDGVPGAARLLVGNAAGTETIAAAIADATANGTLLEIYANSSNVVTAAVMVNTYADTVATVTEADAEKGIKASVTLAGGATFETDAFAEDDVVLYTKAGSDVMTMVKAESKTVTPTWQNATSFVADGTTYKYSATKNATISSSDVTNKVAKVIYLDQYGYVIKIANPASAAPNYAYVLDAATQTVMFENDTYYAKLLYTDGTVDTVKVAASAAALKDKLVTYAPGTGANTGKVVLTDASAWQSGSDLTITKNVATQHGDVYNNKTMFVIETTVNGKPVYTAYTGITNVPTATGELTLKVVNGTVAVCYIMDATLASTPTTSKDVVYVNAASKATATDVNKGTYYTYNAIVNGTITQIEASVDTLGGFYSALTTNDKGLVTGGTTMTTSAPIATVSETGTAAGSDGIIVLGSTAYIYNDATVVYKVAAGSNVISVSSVGAIKADVDDVVKGYTTNGILTMIVIETV